tara:strand:+ start:566 stop:1444 length:879 start_codon:yes stop_codon:yes gene_type:complete
MEFIKKNLPKLVFLPSLFTVGFFVYGFICWTIYISFSKSKLMPNYDLVGFDQYIRLWSMPRWFVALENLWIFIIFFVTISIVIGLVLAIFLDQKIRIEGTLRTIYLYPMALSFIVTGTAWKWILNPGLGVEKFIKSLGYPSFEFGWLMDPDMAIYTIIMAGIWQSSGFVMALFLAGLRSFDDELIKAAKIDGASLFVIYSKIIIPSMRPVFMNAIIVLGHLAIKSFDLVIALTKGGPGLATDMPATFMFSMAFQRGELGLAAASATMMLMTVVAVIVPYLYSELRKKNEEAI